MKRTGLTAFLRLTSTKKPKELRRCKNKCIGDTSKQLQITGLSFLNTVCCCESVRAVTPRVWKKDLNCRLQMRGKLVRKIKSNPGTTKAQDCTEPEAPESTVSLSTEVDFKLP